MEDEAAFRRVQELFALVVVRNFDLICISTLPPEADSVPLVDANAHLAFSIVLQWFKPVSRLRQQVPQIHCPVELIEFPSGNNPQALRTAPSCGCGRNAIVDVLTASVMEGAYHASRYTV